MPLIERAPTAHPVHFALRPQMDQIPKGEFLFGHTQRNLRPVAHATRLRVKCSIMLLRTTRPAAIQQQML